MAGRLEAGSVERLNPLGLPRNPAFTNLAVVSGSVRTIYVGGQDAVDANGQVVGRGDVAKQVAQVLTNIEAALTSVDARLEDIVKWNVLLVVGQPLDVAFEVFRDRWADRPDPPLITFAIVAGLANPDFLVEMDAIAVMPR
jgi:enamine deaminase RidA (YjgF/YER057c/UK114 family)